MTEQETIQQLKIQKQFNLHPDRAELLDMAIKALEKQIHKKPIEKEHIMLDGYMIYKCPVCDKRVEFYNFCQNCGQKLDWSV